MTDHLVLLQLLEVVNHDVKRSLGPLRGPTKAEKAVLHLQGRRQSLCG